MKADPDPLPVFVAKLRALGFDDHARALDDALYGSTSGEIYCDLCVALASILNDRKIDQESKTDAARLLARYEGVFRPEAELSGPAGRALASWKTPSMKRGLALGKFAPFHRGHQHLVETALSEMDETWVLIYDSPEVTDVPLPVRSAWIRKLYPTVKVIEAWDGPAEVGYTPEIMRAHERYVVETLGIRGVTHFYSGELYGDHMSRALGAVDRRVEGNPWSAKARGRDIRRDPYTHRAHLDPLVYRDFIVNVAFVGAPSTGKTTLAERLARELETEWMPEYGRTYWTEHQVDRRLTAEQLVAIAEGHLEREESLLVRSKRYLFTDTNAITTATFARYYHGDVDARLEALADAAITRYDVTFLCDTDIPYEDTPDRSGETNRDAFQRQVIADLLRRKVPFIAVRGTLDARVAQVRDVLARFRKYMNPLDLERR